MSQVYYAIEKMVGGMWAAATKGDLGEKGGDGDEGLTEAEFATEQEAMAAVQGASSKAGKAGKNGEAPTPAPTMQIVQKVRLQAGSAPPSAPIPLDSPFVVKNKEAGEAAKKARDERRKEEDAEFERTGYIAAQERDVRVREISGTPLPIGRQDRITSTADPGGAVREKGKPEAPTPASRGK